MCIKLCKLTAKNIGKLPKIFKPTKSNVVLEVLEPERVSNPFQAQLAKYTNAIKKSMALYVPNDITTNLCKVEVKDYKKLLQDSITTT